MCLGMSKYDPSKVPLLIRGSGSHLIRGFPNSISIGSAMYAGLSSMSSTQTNRPWNISEDRLQLLHLMYAQHCRLTTVFGHVS